MEALLELFFELSNDTRMNILTNLVREPMRLTSLSNKLDSPAQEVSRQLARLEKMTLTRKNSEGFYSVTSYAKHILSLMTGYSFLTENREYSTEHTAEGIPLKFLNRIGELQGSQPSNDVMMAFHFAEETIKGSNERIMILSDQILLSTIPLLEERVSKGVPFYLVVPQDFDLSQPVKEFFLSRQVDNPLNERVRSRFAEEISAVIVASEREVGILAFPSVKGEFDYKGFRSSKKEMVQWATDLFMHYWENSSTKIPDKIMSIYNNRLN